MNDDNGVEDAIDKARTNTDLAPLKRLLGAMIRKRRQVDAQQLNEIRQRVYLSLTSMFVEGQPTPNIKRQLGKVVRAAIVEEYRFRMKLRADASFEDLDERTPADSDFTEVVIEQETLREINVVLAMMAQSDNDSDRKYHAAVIAKCTGKSVTEAVRRSEPTVTPNAAAQTLRRAWQRLKALCVAPESKKVS